MMYQVSMPGQFSSSVLVSLSCGKPRSSPTRYSSVRAAFLAVSGHMLTMPRTLSGHISILAAGENMVSCWLGSKKMGTVARVAAARLAQFSMQLICTFSRCAMVLSVSRDSCDYGGLGKSIISYMECAHVHIMWFRNKRVM
jgi:hypothetical protein